MTTTFQSKSKKTQPPKRKWSGEDDEPDYSRWEDDNDTGTLTADEQRYIRWYHANAHREWRDADVADDDDPIPHVPFMNLTREQRAKKSTQFKFGLCSHCDAGLSDKSEFVCEPRPNDTFVFTCNRCNDYYTRIDCTYRVVDSNGGGGCF